jgi:hypothetical protein
MRHANESVSIGFEEAMLHSFVRHFAFDREAFNG